MTTTQPQKPIDPSEFKTTQRAMWSAIAAGWKKWWPKFESGAQPLNDRLVALARVQPGMRVLDVATGIGEPALTAARAVGPKGSVLAVDLAPQMVALARERARDAGRANVEFREMDAEKLELEPASFDAALSRWGIMLLYDPMAALGGIRRALSPGRLARSGAPQKVRFIAIPTQVATRNRHPAAAPGTPGPRVDGSRNARSAARAQRPRSRYRRPRRWSSRRRRNTAFLTDQSRGSLKKAISRSNGRNASALGRDQARPQTAQGRQSALRQPVLCARAS
jgi:SAM-dependent methyltransferase